MRISWHTSSSESCVLETVWSAFTLPAAVSLGFCGRRECSHGGGKRGFRTADGMFKLGDAMFGMRKAPQRCLRDDICLGRNDGDIVGSDPLTVLRDYTNIMGSRAPARK